jgi:hypothetical protein
MVGTLKSVLGTLLLLFQSRSRLQVEVLALRQQLIVLRRTVPKRVRLSAVDRLWFVLLYRLWPGVLDSIAVIQPDTIVRWHRRGFRAFRRDCLDHVIIVDERHLRNLLRDYAAYYNRLRTHLSLDKDAPLRRPVQGHGVLHRLPQFGGLHHSFVRI